MYADSFRVCMFENHQYLIRPVSTACGHSFCKDCLKKALDLKGECPTCRAPCSLLGVNLVLSGLLENQYPEVC